MIDLDRWCAHEILRADGHPRSVVWREAGWVYKAARKTLVDNECWALETLAETGFVPTPVERLDLETLRMPFIESAPLADARRFRFRCAEMLVAFQQHGVRHGDLTTPHVLVVEHSPVVIDWGECRHWYDPRPDKRPEGDEYWLWKTVEALIDATTATA